MSILCLGERTHTLTAVARDTAGNTATSDEVSITVDNGPPQNVVVIMSATISAPT